MRYGNLIRPSFIDATGALITDNIKNRLSDNVPTFIEEQDVTTGNYPSVFVRHTDIPTRSGNRTLANGNLFAPYTLRSVSYGKVFTTTSISVEDTFEAAIVMLDDVSITEPRKPIVDAYTQLETPQKLYDRSVAWLEDNLNDESEFICSRTGNTVDFGSQDIIINADATVPFMVVGSTVGIHADTFTGNIVTTGTVRLQNGAVVDGLVTDISGTTGIVTLL